MNKLAFKKYIWLIDTIYQSGNEGISYERLCEMWNASSLSQGKKYPLRTFHNHRNEIKDVFNVSIRCRKSTNTYYISDEGRTNPLLKKILELISVNQVVGENESLLARMQMEVRPGGECYLSKVMDAISKNHLLQLEYKPYWSEKELVYSSFAPFALKEFKGAWYLLGTREGTGFEWVDLKDVTDIKVLQDTFTPPTEDAIAAALTENFGTKVETIETQEITVKVRASLASKLRANPLHTSQRELERKRSYSIFYYYLKPTEDFLNEILSFGSAVEVMMPLSLRSEILKEAKKIIRINS